MNTRYVFKYLAIVLLIAVSTISAIVYSRYEGRGQAQSVSIQDTSSTTNYNTYPISPHSMTSDIYISCQNVGGSGDDYIRDYLTIGDYIYLIGDSTSHDRDIRSTASHSVFVAGVDSDSLVKTRCTTISNATYISSIISDDNIVLAYSTHDNLTISILSRYLSIGHTVTISANVSSAYIVCTSHYIHVAYIDSTLKVSHIDTTTYEYTTTTLPICDNIVGACEIQDHVLLSTTLYDTITLYSIDDSLAYVSTLVGQCDSNISMSPINNDVLLLYSRNDSLYVERYDYTLKRIFTTQAISGHSGTIVLTSATIIVFSYDIGAVALCRHGDIISTTSISLTQIYSVYNDTILCRLDQTYCTLRLSPIGSILSTTYTTLSPIAQIDDIFLLNATSPHDTLPISYGGLDGYLIKLK